MKYYLDTNAIYHVNKIPKGVLEESFYSVFGLIEIIAGLNEFEFSKRKAILASALNSIGKCDFTFPEQLIFESFNCFNDYEFVEQRTDDLMGVINDILSANSFAEFHTSILLKDRKYDFNYFVNRDNFYTENFANSTKKGNEIINQELKQSPTQNLVKLANKEYNLNSRRAIIDFLSEPFINSSFTILALANSAMNISLEFFGEISEENVYNSYNGFPKYFVDGMSAYSVNQIINNLPPNRNDFQDLIHILYLRNSDEIRIISNDGIFARCIPERVISLNAILA